MMREAFLPSDSKLSLGEILHNIPDPGDIPFFSFFLRLSRPFHMFKWHRKILVQSRRKVLVLEGLGRRESSLDRVALVARREKLT